MGQKKIAVSIIAILALILNIEVDPIGWTALGLI